MAGQTINDRLLAARHSIAGQGLAKSVCKATTEEMIGPKKKHLDYLIHCTNEPNVSIPQMANLLIERSQNTNWVVVFKALITVHHMLCYGNERFTQYLASSNSTFQLSNFLDKSGVQVTASGGGSVAGYDMSPFIRRYAKYLNEKALSYRTVAFDFCKVKRGKEDGTLRTMNAEKLLKTLPVLQAQLDALLEFDCTANDLTNGVINMAFMLLFRDLIRLFACYNDGIINLLEKYFDMNKKQCRDALDLYKKFLIRMDRVAEFLKVAENVGIDKGDIPDLTKAPSSLLDALEQHLASLEGKKGSAANTPTQTASNRTNVKSGVSALSSTSTSFGTAANNTRLDSHAGSNGIDESLKQQALAEEEAAMNQYKAKVSSPTGASTNPFLSSPTNSAPAAQPIVDLFGSPTNAVSDPMHATKASDDLLQLSGNPFADMFGGVATAAPAPAVAAPAPAQDMWLSNGFGAAPAAGAPAAPAAPAGAFVSDQSFSSVFGGADAGSAAAGMGAAAAAGAANPFMSDFGGAADLGVGAAPASGGLFDAPSTAGAAPDGGIAAVAAAADPFGGGDLFGDAGLLQPSETPGEGADAQGAGTDSDAEAAFAAASKAVSPPPPRPPPPTMVAGGGTSRTASPAPLSGSPSRPPPPSAAVPSSLPPATTPPLSAAASAAPKSAFDDLNESIRAALGGSPSRPQPAATAAPPPVQPSAAPSAATAFAGFGSFDLGGGGPMGTVAGPGGAAAAGGMMFGAPGFGSPAKQGMAMAGFDALGDVLTPIQPLHTSPGPVTAGVGGLMQPAGSAATDGSTSGKVLTGDLDSSLASLAQNLTINKGAQAAVKGVQWNSPKNAAKPGAAGWTPQPMAATTGAGYRPMGMAGMRPMAPGAVGAPMTGMIGGAVPSTGGMMGAPRIPGVGGPSPGQPPQQPPLDPFGAL